MLSIFDLQVFQKHPQKINKSVQNLEPKKHPARSANKQIHPTILHTLHHLTSLDWKMPKVNATSSHPACEMLLPMPLLEVYHWPPWRREDPKGVFFCKGYFPVSESATWICSNFLRPVICPLEILKATDDFMILNRP